MKDKSMSSHKMHKIVQGLASLGEQYVEDSGAECPLCDYQPSWVHHLLSKNNLSYRPPYAPPPVKTKVPEDPYPHFGHEDCLIFKAMELMGMIDQDALKEHYEQSEKEEENATEQD